MIRAITLACTGMLLAVTAASAQTANFPTRTVRVIVPFTAGGPLDTPARLMAQKLSELWGQQVIIDNRPGAGGILGFDVLAKAAPDGYTLGYNTTSVAILPALNSKMPYNALKDFAPITKLISPSTTLVARLKLPADNVADIVALAKKEPGKLTFGSGGNGSFNHLAGELLKSVAKINLNHVPYKGAGAAMNDLIGGQIDMMFVSTGESVPQIKSGTVKGIAVTNPKRSTLLPDVPTIGEAIPGYAVSIWHGYFAPAATPPELVRKIADDIAKVTQMPDVRERLEALGAEIVTSSPEVFAKDLAAETAVWAKVVKEAGIKTE